MAQPDNDQVKKLKLYVDHLIGLRQPWSEAWQMVKDVVRPVRPWNSSGIGFRKTTLDDLISNKIMDNAAGRAVRTLASGLFSGLTPPTMPWFALKTDDELMEIGPVRDWLWRAQELIYGQFARSGFYTIQQALDMDIASFCSGCAGQSIRPGTGMSYTGVPIGSFVWDVDAAGRVVTVGRLMQYPAGELFKDYGNKVSDRTRRIAEDKPYELIDVVHLVMPREKRDITRLDRVNKPYASYLYEDQGAHLIDEGGFDTFPYLCARWDVQGGEIYGRGAGFDALPDVRMLQGTAKDQSEALRMSIKPPMLIPASMKDNFWMIPGATNYYNSGANPEAIRPLYQVQADIGAVSAKIADLRQAIREGYFNDLFLMINSANKNMTATEVVQKNSERIAVLAPVVMSHETDILDPSVSAEFYYLLSSGALDPVPEELQGQALKIEFTSILAQAQKLPQAAAIRSVAADVAGMAQLDPSVLDKFDFDQAVDEISSIEGVPSKVIRSDDAVAEIRQQRAEAQQAQQQMAAAQQMGQAVLSAGNTSTEPGTLMGDLMNGGA